ncbi:uncharacterized protein METZ01_LOCUS461304, partial [marine metagenome]
DEFHRQIGVGAFDNDLVDLDVSFPTDSSESRSFPGEAFLQTRVVREFRAENLESDPSSFSVGRGIDDAVAASAETTLEDVPVDPLRVSRRQWLHQNLSIMWKG